MTLYHLFSRLEKLDIKLQLEKDKLKIDAPKGLLTPDLLEELKDKKKDIIEFLQKQKAKQIAYISIEPVEKKQYYVLSSAQERMYFLQQMNPKNTVYNMAGLIGLDEHPNIKKLEEAFQKLIKRHESLRTSFTIIKDTPVQVLHDEVEFKLLSPQEEEIEEHAVMEAFKNFVRPFDLSQPPLFRIGLIKIKNKRYLLMVDMHHSISDGVSQQILEKDFVSIYSGIELPPLRLQYKDYAQWQNSGLRSEALRQQERYWLSEFAGEIPPLNLPWDYTRPSIQSFEGAAFSFDIPREETAALKKMALQGGFTLYMTLLALFNVWLSKISGRQDITIGTPEAGRRHDDLENIIGIFINTLSIRNYPLGDKPFNVFLREVSERTLQAFENQDYQFEDLVEKVVKTRDPSRNPLFDVMVVLQNIRVDAHKETPPEHHTHREPEPLQSNRGVSMFDMTLRGSEVGEGIAFQLIYCTRLFKETTIQKFIKYFKNILSRLIADPGMKLSEIEILTGEEKKQLLEDFNDTEAIYPQDKTIHRLFEEQAEKKPDRIALVGNRMQSPGNETTLSYGELNRSSNRLAAVLKEKGVEQDTIVGIMTERSPETITGILGILKAGGAYMPIDPDYPQERIDFMLKDSNTAIVLNFENLNFDIVSNFEFRASDLNSSELAYIIYTSGTTGNPKGVMIEHRNVVRLLFNDKFPFDFNSSDIWTMFHSYCFDFSVWEMYGALLYGGKLLVIPKIVTRDFRGYLELLKKKQVTVLNQTPSAFYNLVKPESETPGKELNIRYVIFGGEALTPSRLKEWKTKYPGTKLINMYGITETTVHVTVKEIDTGDIALPVSNIGKPIPTLSAYVMDAHLMLLPVGVPGELCVGGKGVGRGYLNRVELTKEKFVTNPYRPEERLYKSGDLVKLSAGGDLHYLGRIDHQVKIRGFRIEPGEIENQLALYPGLKSCVVMPREKENGENDLCAYITAENPIPLPQLREFLLKRLPEYMIPSYFLFLEQIPLTVNGKIDKKALPNPEDSIDTGEYVPPRDGVEEKLVRIWSEVLGIKKEKIGITHNFFEIGGTSINLIKMVSKIYREFGFALAVAQIYETPLIEEIAEFVRSKKYIDVPVVLLNQQREKKIFCFPPQLGYSVLYQSLANIVPDYAWYGFNFIEDEDRLQQYIDYITGLQPEGPYIFYGYSSGGKLSFEVARAMENTGRIVSDIIFWDCFFYENPTREVTQEDLDELHLEIEGILKTMDALFLKDSVCTKTDAYMRYYHSKNSLEKAKANIHLILSEEIRKGSFFTPTPWDEVTTGKVTAHDGFGSHKEMFEKGTIEKNVKIVREILNGIEEQRLADSPISR